MPANLDGLLWLIVFLITLLFLQRWLHFEIQAVFLILTRHRSVSITLFSLLFFPGILLHELSHLLLAWLLRVRTGRFSIFPQVAPGGRLQLGYVETARTDLLRSALIGAAPLLAGGLFVTYAAIYRLELIPLWEMLRQGQVEAFLLGLAALPNLPDFALWFYLTFTISSTMLPSDADRHAWLPLGLFIALLIGLGMLAGAGPWMLAHFAPPLNIAFRALAALFGLSGGVHLVLLIPAALLRRMLARLFRLDVT